MSSRWTHNEHQGSFSHLIISIRDMCTSMLALSLSHYPKWNRHRGQSMKVERAWRRIYASLEDIEWLNMYTWRAPSIYRYTQENVFTEPWWWCRLLRWETWNERMPIYYSTSNRRPRNYRYDILVFLSLSIIDDCKTQTFDHYAMNNVGLICTSIKLKNFKSCSFSFELLFLFRYCSKQYVESDWMM